MKCVESDAVCSYMAAREYSLVLNWIWLYKFNYVTIYDDYGDGEE